MEAKAGMMRLVGATERSCRQKLRAGMLASRAADLARSRRMVGSGWWEAVMRDSGDGRGFLVLGREEAMDLLEETCFVLFESSMGKRIGMTREGENGGRHCSRRYAPTKSDE